MPALAKQIERYPVKYLLITFQRNLASFLKGSSIEFKMPVLSSGTWDNVYFTPGNIELIETIDQTNSGPRYEYSLSSFLPGDFYDLSQQLNKYARARHLVLMVMENGSHIMMGNQYQGAVFTYRNSPRSKGASLNWSFLDSKSIQGVEWLPQFKITAQGMLQQLYGDNNTYSLAGDGSFSVIGPDSPYLYINETELIQA